MVAALEKGSKITYIDPRVTVTATKAHRYWMIRPGTDLAFNYALIHVILKERLYDIEYVDSWVQGLPELQSFIQPYTPEWAEKETGIPAQEIVAFARELGQDKPAVIFHYGYRCANHTNELYMRRSIGILNVLMGSMETPGGYLIKKGPAEVGAKKARKLLDQKLPEVDVIRFDKLGTSVFPLPELKFGVARMLPFAIPNEDPYPIKALINHCFDTVFSIWNVILTIAIINRLFVLCKQMLQPLY